MPTILPLNTVVTSPSDEVGGIEQYFITLTGDGKYVLEIGGTASVLGGIWGPFPANVVPFPGPPYGMLRVCGKKVWGCRILKPGLYLLQVTQGTAGPYTVKIRHWQFSDYLMINLHKSTC